MSMSGRPTIASPGHGAILFPADWLDIRFTRVIEQQQSRTAKRHGHDLACSGMSASGLLVTRT
jgi:hypothetical protein